MRKDARIGFALCGSFCTFDRVIGVLEQMTAAGMDVYPIMSETAAGTDTRFGTAAEHIRRLRDVTGREPITSVAGAEPLGPAEPLDALLIAPCTGNTLAKLSAGIADTPVTLAVKSHLRNGRPVVIALSTNDGLGANGENVGRLLNRRNVYFVPFRQDDPVRKPASLVADFSLAADTVAAALAGRQLQPVLLG